MIGRKEQLESYVPILRGLINYHKRMTFGCDEGCPKAGLSDIYLEAMEESLRLVEKEISALQSI